MSHRIEPVNPPTLMKPFGYSHGYQATGGRTLFLSGQIAKNAQGEVVGKGDIVAQFRQVCENLNLLVTAAGLRFTRKSASSPTPSLPRT